MPSNARLVVWEALSDLFLDTDIGLLEDGIVRTLAESPYDVSELEDILLWEIYPACRQNLAMVAGEWSGFEATWLQEHVVRPRSWWGRVHTATCGRLWVRRSPEWRRIKARLRA